MAKESPVAASRFGISIDGVQIASFSELLGIATKVDATPKSRGLLAHELTHVVQQKVGKRDVTVRLSKLENSGLTSRARLRKSAGRRVKLTAYNKFGAPILSIIGLAAKVDTDTSQQEWSITYETIQRVL